MNHHVYFDEDRLFWVIVDRSDVAPGTVPSEDVITRVSAEAAEEFAKAFLDSSQGKRLLAFREKHKLIDRELVDRLLDHQDQLTEIVKIHAQKEG